MESCKKKCAKKIAYLLFIMLLLMTYSCNKKNINLSAEGYFEAESILVSSETMGKLVSINIQEGDTVYANQELAVIDTMSYYLENKLIKEQKKALLTQIPDREKKILECEVNIDFLSKNKKRIYNLLKENAVADQTFEEISTKLEMAQANLLSLNNSIDISTNKILAELSILDTKSKIIAYQKSKCILFSPINGTILNRYYSKGEVVLPGRPILKIADMSLLYLKAYVTNSQLEKIKLGQTVDVYYSGRNHKIKGEVSWISETSEFTPNNILTNEERENLVYAIKIRVNNDGSIRNGMFGEVDL